MNPIEHFESAFRCARKADLKDRANQLLSVGDAIDHYLDRVTKSTQASMAKMSEAQRRGVVQAIAHLRKLSVESHALAAQASGVRLGDSKT